MGEEEEEEEDTLEAHWARHGGISANWWEYCNNSRKKISEYREMQRPFPCRRHNKKSLPDLFPRGYEAMFIKTSLLIPHVGWLPQNLNPKIPETVTKWKIQATKVCKFLCLSCSNPYFSTALHVHLLHTNIFNLYYYNDH